jgi:hypothetical protein
MAAAPDDDARRTLAELEAKLRQLERELLRGHDPDPPVAQPQPEAQAAEPEPPAAQPDPLAAEPPPPSPAQPPDPLAAEPPPHSPAQPPQPLPAEPPPEPEPLPTLDLDTLDDARDLVDDLRATIDDLGVAAGRIAHEARAVVEDHGRTLARLELAARAAGRAEEAAAQAGRIAGTVVIEAGPFADARAVVALRDALAAQPDARDAYVRGVEDGRAVIEVHLAPPSA